jgi:hypothetical protein
MIEEKVLEENVLYNLEYLIFRYIFRKIRRCIKN